MIDQPTGKPLHQSVTDRLDAATAAERRLAFRSLLAQPMLSASGVSAERFAMVRRHADWLREWLAANCGWGLHMDSEFARLQKTPPDTVDGTRPAETPGTHVAFNRRKYVVLCLALATLERGDRQTTLGNLAEEIIALAAADSRLAENAISFDLSTRDQRSDLVQVIRYLLELRVLERIDGDELEYLRNQSDVLYNVNRSVLAMMLNARVGPSAIDGDTTLDIRMQRMIEEHRPETDDARNRELRFRVTRRLLDDPVVYFDDLDEDELDYLTKQRGRLLRRIEDATGMVPEIRAEGIAMLDDRGDLTDLEMPKDGTEGHFTLLVAEFLANKLRHDQTARVSLVRLAEHARMLIAEHASRWKKAVREADADVHLLQDAIVRLEGLRLIARRGDDVCARAAIARYGVGDTEIAGATADGGSEMQQQALEAES